MILKAAQEAFKKDLDKVILSCALEAIMLLSFLSTSELFLSFVRHIDMKSTLKGPSKRPKITLINIDVQDDVTNANL